MKWKKHKKNLSFILIGLVILSTGCEKTRTIPATNKPFSLTVVNAIPTSNPIYSVINTAAPVNYFEYGATINYGKSLEFSPVGGMDTIYVIQNNDTLNAYPKSPALLFYNVVDFKPGGIYSLFLTGDTSSPDYLMTNDSIPYYPLGDSVMGVRFVNLATGSDPVSINISGNPAGTEVASLSYKGITEFKTYANNSSIKSYQFVIRKASTGDSLTKFVLNKTTGGHGLIDPNTNKLLTFKNVTIALYGSQTNHSFPLKTMLVENY